MTTRLSRGIVQVLSEHPDVQIVAEASDYAGLRNELKKHGNPTCW